VGAKRGRKPKDFATYKKESKSRIKKFKELANDPDCSIVDRKKWRSCASALKTRLMARYREFQEKRERLREQGLLPPKTQTEVNVNSNAVENSSFDMSDNE